MAVTLFCIIMLSDCNDLFTLENGITVAPNLARSGAVDRRETKRGGTRWRSSNPSAVWDVRLAIPKGLYQSGNPKVLGGVIGKSINQ